MSCCISLPKLGFRSRLLVSIEQNLQHLPFESLCCQTFAYKSTVKRSASRIPGGDTRTADGVVGINDRSISLVESSGFRQSSNPLSRRHLMIYSKSMHNAKAGNIVVDEPDCSCGVLLLLAVVMNA